LNLARKIIGLQQIQEACYRSVAMGRLEGEDAIYRLKTMKMDGRELIICN
jgi:hypothetical protein